MPGLDRTFSAADVIRIYEKHLTGIERLQVLLYLVKEDEAQPIFTQNEVEALEFTKAQLLNQGQIIDNVITTLDELQGKVDAVPLDWTDITADVMAIEGTQMQLLLDVVGDMLPILAPEKPQLQLVSTLAVALYQVVELIIDLDKEVYALSDLLGVMRFVLQDVQSNAAIWADKVG